MFKQLLAKISKCRPFDDIRGRHIYTEEAVDLLMERVSKKLGLIEQDLIKIREDYRDLKNVLEALYKHNVSLVKKYGKRKRE